MRREKDDAERAVEVANELSQKHRLARDYAEAQVAAAKGPDSREPKPSSPGWRAKRLRGDAGAAPKGAEKRSI